MVLALWGLSHCPLLLVRKNFSSLTAVGIPRNCERRIKHNKIRNRKIEKSVNRKRKPLAVNRTERKNFRKKQQKGKLNRPDSKTRRKQSSSGDACGEGECYED